MAKPGSMHVTAIGQLLASAFIVVALSAPAFAVDNVPRPEPRPERAGERPGATDTPADETPPGTSTSEIPKPEPRPDHMSKPVQTQAPRSADTPAELAPQSPPPRPAQMPADEVACRGKLESLGVTFAEAAELVDPAGCSVAWPVTVTSLSKTVKLTPDAVLACETALRAASFTQDVVAPRAQSVLGSALTSIRQDSAYVCRPRHGTGKLSEHAFGSAIDIGAFVLADGRSVVVGSAAKPEEAEFMLAVRLAACGPFTTVLGPGSDADHASHFHFDLAKRRSGSLYCQ